MAAMHGGTSCRSSRLLVGGSDDGPSLLAILWLNGECYACKPLHRGHPGVGCAHTVMQKRKLAA